MNKNRRTPAALQPSSTEIRRRSKLIVVTVHGGQSVTADVAILTDLAGGVVHVAPTALHPDAVDSPTDPTLSAPHPTHTAGHRTDPT